MALYRTLFKDHKDILKKYFGGAEIGELPTPPANPNKSTARPRPLNPMMMDFANAKNNWTVINCHIDELSDELKKFPHGRLQVSVSRYQDQVTAVINELEL